MLARLKNGAVERYPYSIAQLRQDHPDISFPAVMPDELLAEYGVVAVEPTERPSADHTKLVLEGTPSLSDGKWRQAWTITDASQDLIDERLSETARSVRTERDALLAASVDRINPMRWETFSEPEKDAWRAYRQALLDIPDQPGFPFTINWPTAPAA